MQKKNCCRNFFGDPLQTSKKFQGPPFLPWKLWVNPIQKHVNSIFTGKFVVMFFKVPLTRVKYFKGPPFCIRPPNKCLWTVPNYTLHYAEWYIVKKASFAIMIQSQASETVKWLEKHFRYALPSMSENLPSKLMFIWLLIVNLGLYHDCLHPPTFMEASKTITNNYGWQTTTNDPVTF